MPRRYEGAPIDFFATLPWVNLARNPEGHSVTENMQVNKGEHS